MPYTDLVDIDAGNLVALCYSEEGVTEAGGLVSQWDNQAAANHFTQGTAANKPTYLDSGDLNGYPLLRFDGNDELRSSVIPATSNDPRTLLVVISQIYMPRGGVGDRSILHYGSALTDQAYGLNYRLSNVDAWGNHYWGSRWLTAMQSWDSFIRLIAMIAYDGSNDHLFFNGVETPVPYTIALNTGNAFGLVIGGRINGPTESYIGTMACIAAWSSYLSDANRLLVFKFLGHKYDIPVSRA